jgi:hypothetical protein
MKSKILNCNLYERRYLNVYLNVEIEPSRRVLKIQHRKFELYNLPKLRIITNNCIDFYCYAHIKDIWLPAPLLNVKRSGYFCMGRHDVWPIRQEDIEYTSRKIINHFFDSQFTHGYTSSLLMYINSKIQCYRAFADEMKLAPEHERINSFLDDWSCQSKKCPHFHISQMFTDEEILAINGSLTTETRSFIDLIDHLTLLS